MDTLSIHYAFDAFAADIRRGLSVTDTDEDV